MSRKKKELKSNFISVRVTKSFKAKVNNLANYYGISKTDLILTLLSNHNPEADCLKNIDIIATESESAVTEDVDTNYKFLKTFSQHAMF